MSNGPFKNGVFTRHAGVRGLFSRCCCEDDCSYLVSGATYGIDGPNFNEGQIGINPNPIYGGPVTIGAGRIVEMCKTATVKDWEYIWNPRLLIESMTIGTVNRPVCVDLSVIPVPSINPDIESAIVSFASQNTYRIINTGNAPEYYPFTSHDNNEAGIKCWDFHDRSDQSLSDSSLICGDRIGPPLQNCDNEEEYFPRLAIDTGPTMAETMYDAWIYDRETPFGKIIREGEYAGWFETPLLMRSVLFATHYRMKRAGCFAGTNYALPPPLWEVWKRGVQNSLGPYGSPASAPYYSVAQNIEYDVIIRTKSQT